MFDVHYHLIFGVDDGAKTINDSIALAEASIAEGVTHIVATPHANLRYPFQPELNLERLEMIKMSFEGRLTLGLGCEFHLSYDNIADLERHPGRYTVNGKQYLLVEFAELVIPRSLSDVLLRMRDSGIVPVITHPERNPVLAADPQRLDEWIEIGCLLQVTAGSLLGDFGRKAESVALDLIRRNRVHLVASDAHAMSWRPPSMRRAYDLLQGQFGQATADRLCLRNPRAVFFGEHLPPQPKPAEGPVRRQSRKRGLLSRLLGK
ncbi:MAG: CpsB/CapC family capsule biosynthesis tyrosine phosphatase [Terracidiphilus sp.]